MALQIVYDEENPVSWDPFINFSVTDENGISLMPQLEYYTGSSGQGLAVNEILFTPREGMKAIRLTPLYYAGRTETVRAMFDSEPAEGGKLELTSFSVDKQKRIVTVSYRVTGVRILDSFDLQKMKLSLMQSIITFLIVWLKEKLWGNILYMWRTRKAVLG